MRYTYTEFVSKNRAGGLKQIKQSNKVVHQYESENIGRCHVLLLDKYLSKLPPGAKENDTFYLKLKQSAPTHPLKPWYTQVPIGRNVLGQMVKNMFKDANIEKPVTNHSLVPYGVSKMFAANVPEKIIMERSGHCSLEGVKKYEQTNPLQELQVCQVLDNKPIPNNQPLPAIQQCSQSLVLPPAFNPAIQQPLQPVVTPPPFTFQGCSFNNCTFQMCQPSVPEQVMTTRRL